MQEFDEKQPDRRENVLRFERMLKNQERSFLDLDVYEQVVEHYIDAGNWDRALEACNLGLDNFPYSLELLLDKGHLLAQNSKFEEAMEIMDRVSLFHPNDIDVLYMKAGILSMTGEADEAIEIYESILQFADEDEKDDILFQIGHTYQDVGKYDEAVEYYKKTIDLNINHENALYELAFCLDITEKLESSLGYYESLIDQRTRVF